MSGRASFRPDRRAPYWAPVPGDVTDGSIGTRRFRTPRDEHPVRWGFLLREPPGLAPLCDGPIGRQGLLRLQVRPGLVRWSSAAGSSLWRGMTAEFRPPRRRPAGDARGGVSAVRPRDVVSLPVRRLATPPRCVMNVRPALPLPAWWPRCGCLIRRAGSAPNSEASAACIRSPRHACPRCSGHTCAPRSRDGACRRRYRGRPRTPLRR
jgi:hypothetical protein